MELEYRVLQLYSKDAGKREAKLIFDVGQGSQDLGFRNEVDILFTAVPAAKVTLRVLDSTASPPPARFPIRDEMRRVYPSADQAPCTGDFFFHPQVYRADGESRRCCRRAVHDRVWPGTGVSNEERKAGDYGNRDAPRR